MYYFLNSIYKFEVKTAVTNKKETDLYNTANIPSRRGAGRVALGKVN